MGPDLSGRKTLVASLTLPSTVVRHCALAPLGWVTILSQDRVSNCGSAKQMNQASALAGQQPNLADEMRAQLSYPDGGRCQVAISTLKMQ